MFTGSWLADAEFFCDQEAADAVFDQVAVDLGGEVFFGLAEPGEDLEGLGLERARKARVRVILGVG